MSTVLAKLKSPLLLSLVLFVAAVLVTGVQGEFAINDDWIFYRQVEAFLMGNFRISAEIDPSFIFQGILGMVWVGVFGLSFLSLRVLTVIVTVFLLTGIYQILVFYGVRKKLSLVVLLLVVFNPIIFSSAFNFMTENYFLAFFVWCLYFYLRYFRELEPRFALLGSIFTALSFLVREFSALAFAAFFIAYVLNGKLSLSKVKTLVLSSIPLAIAAFLYLYWPSHGEPFSLTSTFIESQFLPERIRFFIWVLPYFSYFSLPLLISHFLSLGKTPRKAILLLAIILTIPVYLKDLFPLGSVFYLEELHGKTNFKSTLSFFDFIPFKIFLSYLISLGMLCLVYLFRQVIKNYRKNLFLLIAFVSLTLLLLFTPDFYDRYLLTPFLVLLILLLEHIKNLRIGKAGWAVLGLFVFISFALNFEFITTQRLKWQMARKLYEDTGLQTQIFLNGTYTKFTHAQKKGDYTGLIKSMPNGLSYVCYVEDYNLPTQSPVFKSFYFIDETLQEYMEKPVIYGRKKLEEHPSIKKHTEELLYNEEYFSFLYNLVGKKSYVGGWCKI